MIPIRDNLPSPNRSPIVFALLAINVALFAVQLKWASDSTLSSVWQTWGLVPSQFSTAIANAISQVNPAAGVTWLIFSLPSAFVCLFLHASLAQILGNLLFLWVFGRRVEAALGHCQFLLFYGLCGFLSSLVQVAVSPDLSTPLIGANGTISAILGAYAIRFPSAKIDTLFPGFPLFTPAEVPALLFLPWWFIQQLFYGIGQLSNTPVNSWGIGYWANGVGLFLGAAWMLWRRRSSVNSEQ
jgi:membrane associated rhomboid family serine protease